MPALTGVRVLDLTQFESGTACTEALAWLGADVIKIEPPGRGEQGRIALGDRPDVDSYYFMLLNANKRSVTLDLRSPEGKEILFRLIEGADVFAENFAPGTIERLGFDYDAVRARNPRIIYAQVKGFDPDGPNGNYLSFDPIGQSVGGAVSVTGLADGPPMRPGVNIADTGSGLHLTIGIVAALYQRETTGEGQRVSISMQEAVINFCRTRYMQQLNTGRASERSGNGLALGSAPANLYPCAPGGPNDYVMIYTSRANNDQWYRLLELMERPDLKGVPRFETGESRVENVEELDALIAAWTRTFHKTEVMKILCEAKIPAGAIFDTLELSQDPHLNANGTFVTLDHPARGTFTMPGWPVRMSDSHVPVEPSPLLAAHTEEVLSEILGLDAAELDALKSKGVVTSRETESARVAR